MDYSAFAPRSPLRPAHSFISLDSICECSQLGLFGGALCAVPQCVRAFDEQGAFCKRSAAEPLVTVAFVLLLDVEARAEAPLVDLSFCGFVMGVGIGSFEATANSPNPAIDASRGPCPSAA
jgi:hypothetical protein